MEAQQSVEGVRAWFERTTKKSKRALIFASAISTVVMGLMWAFCSNTTLGRLQTFNGALTVPLWGGLWIFFFIFGFLIPSREASFRAQESVERGIELIAGAVAIWTRVGLKVEAEIPVISSQIKETIVEVRAAVKSIEEAAKKNENFLADAKPALDSLKRIEIGIEHEMKSGIMQDFRMAIDAVKMMAPVPTTSGVKVAIPETTPDLSTALKLIGKKKPESSPVQVKV
jgi:acyl carrier protein